MPSPLTIFVEVPLGTAFVWTGVAAWSWNKGLRTAPERAFAAASVLVGLWALADWIFYHFGDVALPAARVRMSLLVLVSLAFFYFGRWLARPRGIADVLALPPVIGTIVVVWTMAASVQYDGWAWLARDPFWFAVFQLQIGVYGALAIYYMGWTLRHATFASPDTRKRLSAILWVLIVGLAVWLSTNLYSGFMQGPGSPVVTVFPLILGFLLIGAVIRVSPRRFRATLRKRLLTPARPTVAILYHNSGSPLAEVDLPGAKGLDPSTLSDLARAVDHILTTALKSDPGALRQLRHGEYYLLFERGAYVTLVLVLEGPPSEGLRSEMRTAIREFESVHGQRLATWETAAGLADKAIAALHEVLMPSVI